MGRVDQAGLGEYIVETGRIADLGCEFAETLFVVERTADQSHKVAGVRLAEAKKIEELG